MSTYLFTFISIVNFTFYQKRTLFFHKHKQHYKKKFACLLFIIQFLKMNFEFNSALFLWLPCEVLINREEDLIDSSETCSLKCFLKCWPHCIHCFFDKAVSTFSITSSTILVIHIYYHFQHSILVMWYVLILLSVCLNVWFTLMCKLIMLINRLDHSVLDFDFLLCFKLPHNQVA